jgi:hypothetical protein
MVRMFAALKQWDARTESSSSSTFRKRFSFCSVRGRVSARSTAASSGVASGVRRERSRPSLTGCSGLAARDLA